MDGRPFGEETLSRRVARTAVRGQPDRADQGTRLADAFADQ